MAIRGGGMSTNASVLDRAETKEDVLQGYFDLIVEQAPVPVHTVDADFKISMVNRRWLDKLGYERSEVLGRPSTDFLTGDSREYSSRDVLALFRIVGFARSVGLNFETRDGQVVPTLIDAQVCRTGGVHRHAFAVMRDPDDRAQYAGASATFTALSSIDLSPGEASGRSVATWIAMGADEGDGADPAVDDAKAAYSQPLPRLTTREHQVLAGLASGARNKEIAAELGVSLRTARFHVEHIYEKLNVHTRTQATRAAIESGLVTRK